MGQAIPLEKGITKHKNYTFQKMSVTWGNVHQTVFTETSRTVREAEGQTETHSRKTHRTLKLFSGWLSPGAMYTDFLQ